MRKKLQWHSINSELRPIVTSIFRYNCFVRYSFRYDFPSLKKLLRSYQFSTPILLYILPFSFIIFAPLAGHGFGATANVLGMIISFYPALDPYFIMLSLPKFAEP